MNPPHAAQSVDVPQAPSFPRAFQAEQTGRVVWYEQKGGPLVRLARMVQAKIE